MLADLFLFGNLHGCKETCQMLLSVGNLNSYNEEPETAERHLYESATLDLWTQDSMNNEHGKALEIPKGCKFYEIGKNAFFLNNRGCGFKDKLMGASYERYYSW